MKKIVFPAICGILLFALLQATACDEKKDIKEDEGIVYNTMDSLDEKIDSISGSDKTVVRGKEIIKETDEGFVRLCPVKFIDTDGTVLDTVLVINEENH